MSAKRVDWGSFSSRSCAFRRRHTSAEIRLFSIRLALPLTISLLSGFAPSARLTVGVSPLPYGLRGLFRVTVCFGTRGEEDLLAAFRFLLREYGVILPCTISK
ncbi:unnamed protein product [Ascophyllum nodosum]